MLFFKFIIPVNIFAIIINKLVYSISSYYIVKPVVLQSIVLSFFYYLYLIYCYIVLIYSQIVTHKMYLKHTLYRKTLSISYISNCYLNLSIFYFYYYNCKFPL